MNKLRSKESEKIINGVPSCEEEIAVCGGVGEGEVEERLIFELVREAHWGASIR